MRALLINAFSADNAGDLLLVRESVRAIEARGDSVVGIIALDPESFEGQLQDVRLVGWPVRRGAVGLLSRIRDGVTALRLFITADRVYSVGGGFLTSQSLSQAARLLAIHLPQLVLGIILRKPLVILPQSVGPFRQRTLRVLVALILRHAEEVHARERTSSAYVRRLAGGAVVHLSSDLAIREGPAPRRQLRRCADVVGLTFRRWEFPGHPEQHQQVERYRSLICKTVSGLLEQGRTVRLIQHSRGPTSGADDLAFACEALGGLAGMCEIVKWTKLDDLVCAYAELDVLVSTRLHGWIMARNVGIPALHLSYEWKGEGVAEMVGARSACARLEEADAPLLLDFVARALHSRGRDVQVLP